MATPVVEQVPEKQATAEDLKADESKVAPLKEKLLELMAKEKLDESEVRPVCEDEIFLRRCLIASLNDEKKAFKMGATGLRWRSAVKPSKITLDDFPTAASQHLYELACHAKNGWPVVFGKAKNWNPWRYSTLEYVKMTAFIVETCEKAMDPEDPYARIYVILDMSRMSKFNADLRKIAQLANIACVYYPERIMGVAVNADLLTMTLWKFLSPLLDKRTRDRVSIFRSNFGEFLEENVGMENVGPSLGGSRLEEWPPMSSETAQSFKWDAVAASITADNTSIKRKETDETEASAEAPEFVDAAN